MIIYHRNFDIIFFHYYNLEILVITHKIMQHFWIFFIDFIAKETLFCDIIFYILNFSPMYTKIKNNKYKKI